MKVLRVKAGYRPEIIEIDGTLESLQKEVDGRIQAVYPWEDPVALICNEEGKVIGLEANRPLFDENGRLYDFIAGTFLIVGLIEDDFGSLSEELAQKYAALFLRCYRLLDCDDGKRYFVQIKPKQ